MIKKISQRNRSIVRSVLEGFTYREVASNHKLSNSRVRGIFYTTIKKLWGDKKYREKIIIDLRPMEKSKIIKKHKEKLLILADSNIFTNDRQD